MRLGSFLLAINLASAATTATWELNGYQDFQRGKMEGLSLTRDGRLMVGPKLEPFFSSDHRTGHGLGLAFCRRVVQSSGGSIRVSSEPGHGATFTVELPLLQ